MNFDASTHEAEALIELLEGLDGSLAPPPTPPTPPPPFSHSLDTSSQSRGMLDESGRRYASAAILLGSDSDPDSDPDSDSGSSDSSSSSSSSHSSFLGNNLLDEVIASLNPSHDHDDSIDRLEEYDNDDTLLDIILDNAATTTDSLAYSPSTTTKSKSKPNVKPKPMSKARARRIKEAKSMTGLPISKSLLKTNHDDHHYNNSHSSTSSSPSQNPSKTYLSAGPSSIASAYNAEVETNAVTATKPNGVWKKSSKKKTTKRPLRAIGETPLPRVAGLENYYNTEHRMYIKSANQGEGEGECESEDCKNNAEQKTLETLKLRSLGLKRGIARLKEEAARLEQELELPQSTSLSSTSPQKPPPPPKQRSRSTSHNNQSITMILQSEVDSLKSQLTSATSKVSSAAATERELNTLVKEIYNDDGGVRQLEKSIKGLEVELKKVKEVEKARTERIRLGKQKRLMKRPGEPPRPPLPQTSNSNTKSKIVRYRDFLHKEKISNCKSIRNLERVVKRLKHDVVNNEQIGSNANSNTVVSVQNLTTANLTFNTTLSKSIDEELRNLTERKSFAEVIKIKAKAKTKTKTSPKRVARRKEKAVIYLSSSESDDDTENVWGRVMKNSTLDIII